MSDTNGITRRTALKQLGVAGTSLAAVGTTAAGSDNWRGTDVLTIKRPFDNPAEQKDIQKAAQELHGQYIEQNGLEEPEPYHVSLPRSENGKLVAAALRMTKDGRLQQYTGFANSARDVGRAHKALGTEVSSMTDETSDEYVTTNSSDSWTVKTEGKFDNYSDPHGELVDNYALKYHDDQPAYTYEETLQMSAGNLAYGSDWLNDYARNRQEWSSSGATMEIEDHQPRNEYSGSFSDSLTLQGTIGTTGGSASVAYGYTYAQSEVDITNESLDSDNRGQWKMDVAETDDPDGPDYNTVTFDPCTMAEYESALNGDILLSMESDAVFTDGWDSHTLNNWNQFSQGSDGCRNC